MTIMGPGLERLESALLRRPAEGERQAGDVVGRLGSGGKGGDRAKHLAHEFGRADAARRIERLLKPRGAEFVSGRVERLGYAVAEQKQLVAPVENDLGDAIAGVIVYADRNPGGLQGR